MITPEQIARNGTEHAEQAALFQWCALAAVEREEAGDKWRANALRMIFAIPNGDQRGDGSHKGAQIAGARLKAEGQRSGVPDIFLAIPRILQEAPHMAYSHGLFIEMKQTKHKREGNALAATSAEQKDWIARLSFQNYQCHVCYGWEHARDVIVQYLS